eukprot:2352478-Rhodomonas_salina.1
MSSPSTSRPAPSAQELSPLGRRSSSRSWAPTLSCGSTCAAPGASLGSSQSAPNLLKAVE